MKNGDYRLLFYQPPMVYCMTRKGFKLFSRDQNTGPIVSKNKFHELFFFSFFTSCHSKFDIYISVVSRRGETHFLAFGNVGGRKK